MSGGYENATNTSASSRLDLVQDRRHVLRAERIALVVDELEAVLARHLARARPTGRCRTRRRLLTIAMRSPITPCLAQRLELRHQAFARTTRSSPRKKKALGQRFTSSGAQVGDEVNARCGIAVLVERRRHGEVEAGAPRRQHEVDLVLRDQPLDGTHGLLRARAVVVFDDLDRHALPALEQDAAGGVDLLHPQLVVRRVVVAAPPAFGPVFDAE